jgi:hypothetical protein
MSKTDISDTQMILCEAVPNGVRVFLVVIGLVPIVLVPYEFLIRPQWDGFSTALGLSILVCIGAILAGVLFLAAGLLGLNKILVFDATSRTMIYSFETALMPLRRKQAAFNEIKDLTVQVHDWTDGPSTYALKIFLQNEHSMEIGSYGSKIDAEDMAAKIRMLIR